MNSNNLQPVLKHVFPQQGFVLLTSLIFLTVLTLIAVISTQNSSLEYQMSTNLAFKERAFQSSEAARKTVGTVVEDYVYQTGWTDVTVPFGIDVINPAALLEQNANTENLLIDSSLNADMDYRIDSNGDGDYSDGGDIDAEITVYKTQQGIAPGSSAAMLNAASGTGKGSSSAVRIYYELRSRGFTVSGSRSNTATEYRIIPN